MTDRLCRFCGQAVAVPCASAPHADVCLPEARQTVADLVASRPSHHALNVPSIADIRKIFEKE